MFLLMIAAQAAGTAPLPSEPVVPLDFDLRTVEPSSGDEIVVSRSRRDDQRLEPLTKFAEEKGLPRAETGIGGNMRLGVSAEAATLGGGTVSNRAMVKLKVPF